MVRPQDSRVSLSPFKGQAGIIITHYNNFHINCFINSFVSEHEGYVLFLCPGASLEPNFPHCLSRQFCGQTDMMGIEVEPEWPTTRLQTSVLNYSPADKMMDSPCLVWLPNFTRIIIANNLHPYLVHRPVVLPGLPTDSCSRIAHTPPLSVLVRDTPHSLAL